MAAGRGQGMQSKVDADNTERAIAISMPCSDQEFPSLFGLPHGMHMLIRAMQQPLKTTGNHNSTAQARTHISLTWIQRCHRCHNQHSPAPADDLQIGDGGGIRGQQERRRRAHSAAHTGNQAKKSIGTLTSCLAMCLCLRTHGCRTKGSMGGTRQLNSPSKPNRLTNRYTGLTQST